MARLPGAQSGKPYEESPAPARMLCLKSGTGPHPHPATHGSVRSWVAGWGCGPVPDCAPGRRAA